MEDCSYGIYTEEDAELISWYVSCLKKKREVSGCKTYFDFEKWLSDLMVNLGVSGLSLLGGSNVF